MTSPIEHNSGTYKTLQTKFRQFIAFIAVWCAFVQFYGEQSVSYSVRKQLFVLKIVHYFNVSDGCMYC